MQIKSKETEKIYHTNTNQRKQMSKQGKLSGIKDIP